VVKPLGNSIPPQGCRLFLPSTYKTLGYKRCVYGLANDGEELTQMILVVKDTRTGYL
jgi:hypothetical protein